MQNSRQLDDLLPQVKARMIGFIAATEMALEAELGKRVKIIPVCTYRDEEAQAVDYASGRTRPGAIKTNAKPGQSPHQFRCAMDFGILIDGQLTWEPQYYEAAGAVAVAQGLTWGGDFHIKDLDHVEWTGGLTLAQLAAGDEVPQA